LEKQLDSSLESQVELTEHTMASAPPPPPCPPPPPSAPLSQTTTPTFEPSTLGLGIAAKIAGICAEKCTVLDLSNCEINSIPMAIFVLTKSFADKIKEINLSSNQLKKINLQTFFEKYPNLKIIDLTNNPLSKRQIETIESHNDGVNAVENVVYEEGENGNASAGACLCKIKYKLM